jgi:hypothetical protein
LHDEAAPSKNVWILTDCIADHLSECPDAMVPNAPGQHDTPNAMVAPASWHEAPNAMVDGPFNAPASQHEAPNQGNQTLTRMERKRQRGRDARQRKLLQERPRKPGYDCPCPCCPRYFNKRGLVSHLYVSHSNNIGFSHTKPGDMFTSATYLWRSLFINSVSKRFALTSLRWHSTHGVEGSPSLSA